jgi:vancomycin resistance protein YoaR
MGTSAKRTERLQGNGKPSSQTGDDASPLAVFDEEKTGRRGSRALVVTFVVAVALMGAYVGACWATADRVPRGTTVAGVTIGGMGRAEALAALDAGLATATNQPFVVTAANTSASVVPADAGLSLDARATVDRLTGFDLKPGGLWEQVFGAGVATPVATVDETKLAAAMQTVATALDTVPIDGTIVFADGAPHATAPVDGSQVDATAAAGVLRSTWLTAARPITLPTKAVAPDIDQADVDAAMAKLATPLMAAPVAVAVAGQVAQLPVTVLARVAAFVPKDSALVLQLDGGALVTEVAARTTALLTLAADGSFQFVNDAPVVVPGTPGTTIDPVALAAAVAAASTSADRTARVALVATDPAHTTAALEALGIKEIVSEFATTLTAEPVRTKNLIRGAEKVNGTVVLPGETFSISKVLAPITEAGGYFPGHQIENGFFTVGIGGGLSQMATTTYNAAFFAGFEDIEHRPHTEYFSRYPEGRESTIFQGQIDVKFKNNTPYGALMQSWVADNQLHVRIWGTKYWTVTSSTSPRSNVVAPTTVHSTDPACVAQSAGNPGFKVTVTRTLALAGVVKATENKSWRYDPQNTIICGP